MTRYRSYKAGRRFLAPAVALAAALTVLLTPALAAAQDARVSIGSKSAILVEPSTGEILYEKDANVRTPIASVTKIMTMLLVMEALESGKIKLTDKVVTSEHAWSMGGSQLWLEVGEEMTVEELMRAVAVESCNDAAVALAEHVAGSEPAFVEMMNARAKELGMANTSFINSTGLPGILADGGSSDSPEADNFSTAYDISLMSRELLKHSKIHEWLTIWITYLRDGQNMLTNTNRLIRFYEGADGLKTGFTTRSKYCLSATAKRGGVRMLAVVLGADTSNVRFDDARKLLDYGFSRYRSVEVVKKGDSVGTVRVNRGVQETVGVVAGQDLTVVVPRTGDIKVTHEVRLFSKITAPLAAGQKVGEVVALRDGVEVAKVDAVAAADVQRAGTLTLVWRTTGRLLGSIFKFSFGR